MQIKEESAGALYGACINIDTLEETTLGEGTVDWFRKRHWRPCSVGGFVEGVVEGARASDTYVNVNVKKDANMMDRSHDDEVITTAMDLFFLERGYCLETLRMLIQHRISIASSATTDTDDNTDNDESLGHIILQATDQLLEAGLVSNLISLVKDLTSKNEQLARKICAALDQEQEQELMQANNHQSMAAAAPVPGYGYGYGFGVPVPAPVPAPAVSMNSVTDADYAMYEFTFQQRQLACQCLFYLTYHTQCTMEEVTSLIDLVKDLTNGGEGGNGGDSVGTGLPILDPIRDVPDPYTLSWNEGSAMGMGGHVGGGGGSNGMNMNMNMNSMGMGGNNNMQMGMQQNNMQMTPQQVKAEKKHDEWKKELLTSLWSVRGLTRATVTRSQADFSGQQLYHAMTLESSSNVDNVNAVGGGKPQLMQSVTTLILTVMCALDGKNVLMDRKLHGPNSMGSGNALVPIDNISTVHLMVKPISDRLDPDSSGFSQWKRQDIAGLLSAAFALLLRPVVDVLASPVSGSSASSILKATFRSILESPTIVKSMTFARVSLIPCLGTASMKPSSPTLDNDFAFFMSVLSDFTAQYLDAICSFGELPLSRQKWMHDEEQELQLRRVQEQQRKQLEEWSGKAYNEVQLPTEVDISKRPDCLDDIIALAVSVCSTCPECSYRFWCNTATDEEGDGNMIHHLIPSKIIKKLEKAQAKDQSLLPVYVSLLSALSLTDDPNESLVGGNGADAVYDWLSQNNRMTSSPTSHDASKQINWVYILYAIQWYAEQLNPPAAEKSQTGWGVADKYQQSSSLYNEDSTSYYYGADDNSSQYRSQSQQGGADATSSRLSSADEKKELDEKSTMILTSFLSLLSHVALKSEESRTKILEIKLPPPGSQRSLTREDDAITVLFALLATPLSPEIRGLTLTALANLVRQEHNSSLSKEAKEKSDDVILRCWELLESCQIIPIARLAQYSPLQNGNGSSYSQNQTKKDVVSYIDLYDASLFGFVADLLRLSFFRATGSLQMNNMVLSMKWNT